MASEVTSALTGMLTMGQNDGQPLEFKIQIADLQDSESLTDEVASSSKTSESILATLLQESSRPQMLTPDQSENQVCIDCINLG